MKFAFAASNVFPGGNYGYWGCVHVFVLQGKCVHSLNLVKCYAGSGQYRSRIETLEELYGLYRRVPNKSLARRTYERINGARSTDATSDGADLYLLKEHLALVTNEEDWNYVLTLLPDVQAGLDKAFFNRERLIGLLGNTNASIRLRAFELISTHDDEDTWRVIGNLLDDAQLGGMAQNRIMEQRRFPLYGAVLRRVAEASQKNTPDTFRAWPYSSAWLPLLGSLTDDDLHELLRQKDRFVDVFCFGAIAVQQKLHFLEQMVAVLNERSSPQAVVAVRELLAGPYPIVFNPREPQHWTHERWLPSATNVWTWCAVGDEYDVNLKKLATLRLPPEPRTQSWEPLRSVFERCVARRFSESQAASLVHAMYLCDPIRTRAWLLEELRGKNDAERLVCVLAGAGTTADPELLPALENLSASPERPNKVDWPRQTACLDYALHRCRGIHLWRLEKDPLGKYVIIKPGERSVSR